MYALVDCNNFYASCERVFQPKFNGKPVAIKYVGYELQSESIWSYLEVPNIDGVKKIDVFTDLLYDFTDKQENIIQVKTNDKKDSYKLDYPKNSTSFVF